MARRPTKKFEFAKDVYYFNLNKDFGPPITLNRRTQKEAVQAYSRYLRTYAEKCEWLGRWDGKKFIEDNFPKLEEEYA